MNTLVVGAGGREHAIVKAVQASPKAQSVYIWPGNDGIRLDALQVPIASGDFPALVSWVEKNNINLVVIGPEVELVAGLADLLRAKGVAVFGPSQEAAQLEGSKIYAKNFMLDFTIPTARADQVSSVEEALHAALKYSPPFVLKADGLAAGKGVTINENQEWLRQSAVDLFDNKKLGSAGDKALLEEFKPGAELSVLFLTNGKEYELLPLCRDHKRIFDGDKGPNTGGMGVIGPITIDESVLSEIKLKVIEPTLQGLQKRNLMYRGVIFVGIILSPEGPQVLEYNVRFGDPETQVIMSLLDGDWLEVFYKISCGEMPKLRWKKMAAACVVLAAEGYPDLPRKGVAIEGDLEPSSDLQVLHAGTARANNRFVTNGGRVLNIVATAKDISAALRLAYDKIAKINWPGMQFRRDIGRT